MISDLFYLKLRPAFASQPVVFLPGWGFSGRIAELIPCLKKHTLIYPRYLVPPHSLLQELATFSAHHNFSRIILAGWSMGANLALDFALKYPQPAGEVHLLAMRDSWPVDEIEAIRQDLHKNPKIFLSRFFRKCFLGYKKEYQVFVREMQDQITTETNLETLDAGLDYLAAYNLPDKLPSGLDIIISHGEKDIIAPVNKRPCLKNRQTKIIPHGGHMFFLAADFTMSSRQDKETISRKFSRAAATYDKYADVQKESATRLAELLPQIKLDRILEIGCGTGNYTKLLHEKYPVTEISALDFSMEMVEQARKKIQNKQVNFFCLDGEKYLAEEKKFDLITSNGALQWFIRPYAAFTRIGRRLTENGWFICAIFGPETLVELQNAFNDVLGRRIKLAASSFLTREQLQNSLVDIFDRVEIDELRLIRRYDSLFELLHHLRKTGTSGFQRSGLSLNRQLIREVDKWFAAGCGHRVSYQIFMICCRKPLSPQ